MLLPIDQLPKDSRVWVFSSNEPIEGTRLDQVNDTMTEFIGNWQSHGSTVKGSFSIKYNRFIVVAADESELPSGCSIDSLFKAIKNLEQNLDISLLDRGLLSFLVDNKIEQVSFKNLKTELNRFKSTKGRIFFNNLVENLSQLEQQWLVAPEESWIKTYL